MAGIRRISKINVVNATKEHTATLFFFHGSGSSGDAIKEWVDILTREELKFPHIKIMYPSAPLQPYTAYNGMPSYVWFDRKDLSIHVPEDVESMESICSNVSELIDAEVTNGIPHNKIIVGGFSMGGGLSLYLTYKHKPSLAGCFAMSSFLNKNSSVYKHLQEHPETRKPPLLQFHGTADELVPIEWGEETHKNLKDSGVKGQFVRLNDAGHELTRSELATFRKWVLEVLSEK